MRNATVRIATLAVLAAAFLLSAVATMPRRVYAATLNAAVIGMFPKDVGEFAYADLKASRKYSCFRSCATRCSRRASCSSSSS